MKNTCFSKYCKGKKQHGNYCYRCCKKKYAEKYPIKYAYQTLRGNAKRRGKEFTITLKDFEKFCIKTKILLGRGRTKDCYSIDRIKENLGYIPGNLQKLKVGENTAKYHKQVKYDWEHKIGMTVNVIEEKECTPF